MNNYILLLRGKYFLAAWPHCGTSNVDDALRMTREAAELAQSFCPDSIIGRITDGFIKYEAEQTCERADFRSNTAETAL